MCRMRVFLRAANILRSSQNYRHMTSLALWNRHALLPVKCCNSKSIAKELYLHRFCSNKPETEYVVDSVTYDRVCSETLDALCDYFEELTENATDLPETDVVYGDGVLSVNFGPANGMYVINRQKPNKQIWLSSPISGPKRFDYVVQPDHKKGQWIYKHTGIALHEVLQEEIGRMLKSQTVDFSQLPYCNSFAS